MLKNIKYFIVFFTLLVGTATQSRAGDWCIRQGSTGFCEILKSQVDSSVVFNFSNGNKVRIRPEWEYEKVEILNANNKIIEEFKAGFVDVPFNIPHIKLTNPKIISNEVALRADAIVEIKTSPKSTFYVPLGGGILLIPDGNTVVPVWIRGGAEPVVFSKLDRVTQKKILALTYYLNLPPTNRTTLSNYFIIPEEIGFGADRGDTSCCCNGTGKKTKVFILPGYPGDLKGIKATVAQLPEKDKECIEIEYFAYDSDECLKELATKLSTQYAIAFNGGQNNYCSIKVIGHSAGGVIAAQAASSMGGLLVPPHPGADVHSIASPLGGIGMYRGVSGGILTATYFIGLGIAVDAAMDLLKGCLWNEVGSGGHNFPQLITSSFTPHTSDPTYTFSTETQTEGPRGSNPPVNHPGTDHTSVVGPALHDILAGTSCCGNGTVDSGAAEQCDPPKSSCTVPGPSRDPGKCDDRCNCIPFCDNGRLDPGEDCDTPGMDCATAGGHVGKCSDRCKCVGCGNGFVDPNEQCDPPGSDCEDGLYCPHTPPKCNNECQCEIAACVSETVSIPDCGDRVVNGSEQCDPPGSQCRGQTASGSGTCNSVCQCEDNCAGINCGDFSRHAE